MAASASLIAAVEAVWRVPRPGPRNLLASPTFIALSELCHTEYGGGKPVFALDTALVDDAGGRLERLPPALDLHG